MGYAGHMMRSKKDKWNRKMCEWTLYTLVTREKEADQNTDDQEKLATRREFCGLE